jgi:hypothetical protein
VEDYGRELIPRIRAGAAAIDHEGAGRQVGAVPG